MNNKFPVLAILCASVACYPQRTEPESTDVTEEPTETIDEAHSGVDSGLAYFDTDAGVTSSTLDAGMMLPTLDGGLSSITTDAGPSLAAPTTTEVYNNLRPICVACHSQGQSFPIFASETNFIDLIVNEDAWVIAGQPENSSLLWLLAGSATGAYSQMPPGPSSYMDMALSDDTLFSEEQLEAWIENLDPNATSEEECWQRPGFRGLQRLTRTEYNNTTRDLLGDTVQPGETFPSDDYSHGFDNIAEVLTLSSLLVEKYELATQTLVDNALTVELAIPVDIIADAEVLEGSVGATTGDAWNLWSNGTVIMIFGLQTEGDYSVSFRGGGRQAGPDPVKVNFLINNQTIATVDVTDNWPEASIFNQTVHLTPGTHSFGVEFTNDYYCSQENFDLGQCDDVGDRNFYVDWLRVDGPTHPVITDRPPLYDDLIPCEPTGLWADGTSVQNSFNNCADTIFSDFGKKAWRRPLTETELSRLQTLAQSAWVEGDSFNEGIQLGFKAILLSPHFIFKVEKESNEYSDSHRDLNGYELASRLAYFLWSSTPDDQLLTLAESGALLNANVLETEISRMLQDTKASALTHNFAAQWLLLRDIDNIDPDYTAYPDFDESLRDAMYQESALLFEHILENNLPLTDLLSADYSFINQRLATHYGMTSILPGRGFNQVNDISHRKGVLTHAGWLALTSNRTRTSPVKRGKWVLERLLCETPPPPPPGVEGLIDDGTINQNLPIRERMEQHRADPMCAACHIDMDAIGFAFENYDAIGTYRMSDHGHAIDPSGSLLGEADFDNGLQLTDLLSEHPQVRSCMTEKMLIYALGRGLFTEESCMAEGITTQVETNQFKTQSLIKHIVQSEFFQSRINTPIAEMEASE